MSGNTIRPTTPQPGASTLPPESERARPSSPARSAGASSALPAGRHAGAAPMGRRVGLPSLPAKVLARVVEELPDASRRALSATSRTMRVNTVMAAIAAARTEADFTAADERLRQLPPQPRGEAANALARRLRGQVQAGCRREGDFAVPLEAGVLRNLATVHKTMIDLPRDAACDSAFGAMNDTVLSAQAAVVRHTSQYLDWRQDAATKAANQARIDAAQYPIAVQLKETTDAMRARGVVHDPRQMQDAIEGLLGPDGTMYSAQTAISELPQMTLDLPPEENARTVELLAELAERAVQGPGRRVLEFVPSWADTLIKERIDVILARKKIDIGAPENERLKNAVQELQRTRDAFDATLPQRKDELAAEAEKGWRGA